MCPQPSPGTPPNCIGAMHFPPIATTLRLPASPIPRRSAFYPHHLAIVAAAAGEQPPLLCARAGGTGSIIGGKDETGGADDTGGADETGGDVDTGTAVFETEEERESGMRSGEGCPMGKEQLRLRGG
ncbi:unnamed protein product [Closterium sp. NIES-64]|nr:unnamed protein product [Closterium sp. NIES-64]